jgi:hypothetical protein
MDAVAASVYGEPDDRRPGPDSNRETTTGIVSRLSLTRSETPMNTGRPVSVETDTWPAVPNRVPKQDALRAVRELVNRLFAGDLSGETRTRTGDTTIFRQMYRTIEHARKARKQAGSGTPSAKRCVRK